MRITVGADPEMFAMKGGQYFSAFGMVPGDKENPHKVNYGAVQVDGMALEFNIDPADSADSFLFNIKSVMAQLRAMTPGYEVVADPVARFSPEYMAQQPLAALLLGCDPDYNAWNSQENIKPDSTLPIRTGAGHIHLGWADGVAITEDHINICERIVKQMDFYLGLPSLLYDAAVERRSMYGKAGAYRPKSYGLEYRVLSNRWLADDRLITWAYKNSVLALESLQDSDLCDQYGDIQSIINNSDIASAQRIIASARIPTPELS